MSSLLTLPASPVSLAAAGLWREYLDGRSGAAREALIGHYRYLVPKTRGRILPTVPFRVSPADLDAEGQLALIRAIDQFEPGRRVRFETYAISLIRGAMLEHLRQEDWVPRTVRGKQRRLARVEQELACSRGTQPIADVDRAAALELSLDDYYGLCREAGIRTVLSLEDLLHEGEQDPFDPLQIQDGIRSEEPGPEERCLKQMEAGRLWEAVGWLPEREGRIVCLYYREGLTFKQIAGNLALSESRVHQLHAAAIRRLRGYLRS
jgi:RNA polymerase sigma factor FliA